MRPLRLFIAPEKLRRLRIILLKITHLPFVAAIWAFEGSVDYLKGVEKLPASGVASLSGPSDGPTNGPKRVSYLRSFTPRTLVAGSLSQASLANPTRESRAKRPSRPTTAATDGEEQHDLKALILKLSAQVEELSAIVAEQSQQTPKDSGDE